MVVEKIGRVSSASVLKGTGKSWDQWITILDRAGGRSMTHKELVAFVKKKYRLGLWWQQGVATGYEMHLGKKIEGRNAKGEYALTAGKTLPLERKKLWKWLWSAEGLAVWLQPMNDFKLRAGNQFEVPGGIFGEVRTLKSPERVRLRWQDENWTKPSVVSIGLHTRKGGKSILFFQHDGLPNEKSRTEMRDFWKSVLDRIASALD